MPGPPTIGDVVFQQNDGRVMEQAVGEAIVDVGFKQDPLFEDLILSNAEISSPSKFARDYLATKWFETRAVAGIIGNGIADNYPHLVGDVTENWNPKGFTQDATKRALDPREGWNNRDVPLVTTLTEYNCNLMFDLAELNESYNPASYRNFVRKKYMGLGKNFGLRLAGEFFGDFAAGFRIGTLGTATNHTGNSSAYTLEAAVTEGTASRVAVGMQVDVYNSSNVRLNQDANGNRLRLFVVAVDLGRDTITLQADATDTTAVGAGGWFLDGSNNSQLGNSAYITYAFNRNSAGTYDGIYGWLDWAIPGGSGTASDNQLLRSRAQTITALGETGRRGTINVDTWKEFASLYYPMGGATLTRTLLSNRLSMYRKAYAPYGYKIDTLAMSHGISDAMLVQMEASAWRDADRGLSLSGFNIDNRLKLSFNGETFTVYESPFLERGLCLGMRVKGNWEVATMPDGGESAQMEGKPSKIPVKYYMKQLGASDNRWPIQDAGGGGFVSPTRSTMLPGYAKVQIMPRKQIPMLVLTNCGDTRELNNDGPISI